MTEPSHTTESTAPTTKRFLSGVQPSGRLHLGNYFGAIKGHIEAQRQPHTECYYFIANYHSLTSIQDRETLLENTREVAVSYLALGLDPERTVFYRQSDVPEVTELTWILSTCVGMGLLERAHSYKDKVARGLSASVGLFTYPVLMAADILGPQSDIVPVGQDQTQHVEMTRDMAAAFNSVYCQGREPVFKLPEAAFTKIPLVPGTTFDKGNVVHLTMANPPSTLTDDLISSYREKLKEALIESKTIQDLSVAVFGKPVPDPSRTSIALRVLPGYKPPDSMRDRTHYEGPLKVWTFEIAAPHTIYNSEQGKRVAAKMSKSYGNTIEIFAEGKPLKKAVMGIETDKKALEDPLDPDDDLVFALYRLFATQAEQEEMREKYRAGGFGYGNAKKALLAKINEHFAEAREKRKQLLEKPHEVEEILQEGARKARRLIGATTEAARDACGIPAGSTR